MPPKGGFVCNVRLWYCFRALLMISLGDENDGSEASAAAHLPLCASHPWLSCTRQSSASVTAAPKSSNTELHASTVQKRIFPRNCVNTGTPGSTPLRTHLSNLSTQCPASGKLGLIPMVHSAQRSNSLIRNKGLSNRGLDFGKDSFSRRLNREEPVLSTGLCATCEGYRQVLS